MHKQQGARAPWPIAGDANGYKFRMQSNDVSLSHLYAKSFTSSDDIWTWDDTVGSIEYPLLHQCPLGTETYILIQNVTQ